MDGGRVNGPRFFRDVASHLGANGDGRLVGLPNYLSPGGVPVVVVPVVGLVSDGGKRRGSTSRITRSMRSECARSPAAAAGPLNQPLPVAGGVSSVGGLALDPKKCPSRGTKEYIV